MKIISSSKSDLSVVESELNGNEPAIIVLPEGSWNGNQAVPNEHAAATLEYRVSLIGTKDSGRGFDVAYVVRRGQVIPVSIYPRDNTGNREQSNFRELYLALNKPHEISPVSDMPVWAIIRQCSEIYRPMEAKRKVDLICVSSSIDHTANHPTKDLLFEKNRRNISGGTLLVQSVLNDIAGTDVFQFPSFARLGKQVDGYKVHKY